MFPNECDSLRGSSNKTQGEWQEKRQGCGGGGQVAEPLAECRNTWQQMLAQVPGSALCIPQTLLHQKDVFQGTASG